ncbi:phospholipase-d-like protein [Pteropox virus]|uniref:Phospholipase-d-like protein n=1 Tax=Pteropox virus TaxID=1873698 RepID=A0A1B1MR92_9POXV|nr:phospholipase-d-like protein [Pteropox virus]ANS71091.1 phospholipase-d-like protein [Pteropox virus]
MNCKEQTSAYLVESIPEGMEFLSGTVSASTFDTWLKLLSMTEKSLLIASFYWSLDDGSPNVMAIQGRTILETILKLPSKGVDVKIAVNKPKTSQVSPDLVKLMNQGCGVKFVDVTKLTGGILHTKFWIVDGRHIYIGSANQDWRSLTEVKEIGIVLFNNSCLAKDLTKIFYTYWFLTDFIPSSWSSCYETKINMITPLNTYINGVLTSIFIASSPMEFSPLSRTNDIDSLTHCIQTANKFVHVSVMNYEPVLYTDNGQIYWPNINDEIIKYAIEKKLEIKLLISCWERSSFSMRSFLLSLNSLRDNKKNIQVKLFIVPNIDPPIPYTRVNHTKYMVTDNTAYIGTSNWTGNYFTETCGVSVNIVPSDNINIRKQLEDVFQRDWNSKYSFYLTDTVDDCRCRLLKHPAGECKFIKSKINISIDDRGLPEYEYID